MSLKNQRTKNGLGAVLAVVLIMTMKTSHAFAPATGNFQCKLISDGPKMQKSALAFPSTLTLTHSSTISSSSTSLSMSSNNQEVQGIDRGLACLPYLLPVLDGDRYGRFIFAAFPPLGIADAILLGPFHSIYNIIPFAQLIAFFGLSFLSRNPEISRSVRFNMQQALILDIMLIFPSLLGRLGIPMPSILVASGSNFIFYVLVAAVGYSLFSNAVLGKLPNQIPILSEASEAQIGPF